MDPKVKEERANKVSRCATDGIHSFALKCLQVSQASLEIRCWIGSYFYKKKKRKEEKWTRKKKVGRHL